MRSNNKHFSNMIDKADYSKIVFNPEYALNPEDFIFKAKNNVYINEYLGYIVPVFEGDTRVISKVIFVSRNGSFPITFANTEESAAKVKVILEAQTVIKGFKTGHYKDHCGHPAFRRDKSWVVFFDIDSPNKWGLVDGVNSVVIMDRYARENKWTWVAEENTETFFEVVRELDLELLKKKGEQVKLTPPINQE